MLWVWIIGIVLFLFNIIVFSITDTPVDDDDTIGFTLFFTLFPIFGVWVNILFFLEYFVSSKESSLVSYTKYNENVKHYGYKKIYLTYKQVKNFYTVNPSAWEIRHDFLLYSKSYNDSFAILFKNPLDYYLSMHWVKKAIKTKTKKPITENKEDENMKLFLSYIQKDIDALKIQSEKEIEEVRQNIVNMKG